MIQNDEIITVCLYENNNNSHGTSTSTASTKPNEVTSHTEAIPNWTKCRLIWNIRWKHQLNSWNKTNSHIHHTKLEHTQLAHYLVKEQCLNV